VDKNRQWFLSNHLLSCKKAVRMEVDIR
jgi:hypothetical protein